MTATTSGRRRRSVQGAGGSALLASPQFGRRLFAAMAVIAVAYVPLNFYETVHAARTYGAAFMGMDRAEVRYIFGPAAAQSADGSLWRMRDGDAETSFLFDAHDQMVAVGCRAAAGGSVAECPDIMGLHLGDTEYAVWGKLGAPSGESYADDSKIMAYPEMGIRLKLRRAAIVAVEHRHVSGTFPFLLRAITLLAP